jgi:hypothetical protein
MIDLEEKLEQLNLNLLKAEKRQRFEYQKIERLVKKSELLLSKKEDQLKSIETKIHAWILQKSRKVGFQQTFVKLVPTMFKARMAEFAVKGFSNVTKAEKLVGKDLRDLEVLIDLPTQPSLHNLFIKRRELIESKQKSKSEFNDVKNYESQIRRQLENEIDVLKSKIDDTKREITRSVSSSANRFKKYGDLSGAKSSPPKMAIENWEDAENFAVKYMRWLGFADARKTRAGSDEGKDVESSRAVAQVKDMGTGVSRPMLQQLFGVAAAEKKIPVFFARSYAKTAKEWGQKHGMALFQFSIRGDVKAVSTKAEQILKKKSS